jgi:adenine phosphoribosyltransferase
MSERTARILSCIRDIPDFPKPGIVFKDITPLLANGPVFQEVIAAFAEQYRSMELSHVVSMESRGFIFGAALASTLGIGFVPIRKPGKLPWRTYAKTYELEYGTDTLEIHADAVSSGDRVVVLDDVLATGGTAAATCTLVRELGATVVSCAFLMELTFLPGRQRLAPTEIFSLLSY